MRWPPYTANNKAAEGAQRYDLQPQKLSLEQLGGVSQSLQPVSPGLWSTSGSFRFAANSVQCSAADLKSYLKDET